MKKKHLNYCLKTKKEQQEYNSIDDICYLEMQNYTSLYIMNLLSKRQMKTKTCFGLFFFYCYYYYYYFFFLTGANSGFSIEGGTRRLIAAYFVFKSLFFALFWHLWLCWRTSYFISDHLLLKNLLRTLQFWMNDKRIIGFGFCKM